MPSHNVSELPVATSQHTPAGPFGATSSCGPSVKENPSDDTSPRYVTFMDDPVAAAEDIAADVAELLDKPIVFYTAADLAKLDKPAFRIVVDQKAWERWRDERLREGRPV